MRTLDTPVKQIRRKIFAEVAKLGFQSTDASLIHDIEAIPYNIVQERAQYRESIYRERAVASERVRLAMGLSLRPENKAVHLTAGVEASNIDEKYYEPPLMQVIPSASEDGICLGFYSNEKFVPVIASRGIADNANTPFKAQSFYKSGNHLFFNPRYSPYIYMIDNDEVSKYMKIISDDFVDNSDLELEKDFKKERGVREQYSTNECLISGVNSFYQCKGHFLAEIWRNHGAPLLLEYEAKEKEGYLFCPLLDPQIKAFTKIAAVSSDFYISYINAQSFLNNYEETVTRKYNLVDDSNPVLMNIYVK